MKSIAGYNVVKLLAKGGMAAIYLAEQQSLQRQVVLKFLNPKLDESVKKRFIDEGRIIASLEHPNVITVFDVVSTDKYNFIAMEFLEGGDLEHRLKEGLDTYTALDIISKIADALHLIHKKGIIHGDVKPANVLFRRNGCPLLTDFGISHQIEPKKEVDLGKDDLYASPTYASPELIQGKPFDYRTDMYSLGIMMYEMLVGEKPFLGKTEIETIANSIQNPIPKLPSALKEFQPLLESLLAKTPEDRLSDSKLVTRFVQQYFKDHPDLKNQSTETQLIDSDVVVEYVSKRKPEKEKKSGSGILSPIILSLILVTIIWLNKDRLWNDWIASDSQVNNTAQSREIQTVSQKKTVTNADTDSTPEILKPLTFDSTTTESYESEDIDNASELLKQSEQDLMRQKELLAEKNAEIERVRKELEEQKKQSQEQEWLQQQLTLEQDEQKQKAIGSLLSKAKKSLKKYHLTTPLNNNALYYYQKVLELEPDNKAAKEGIKDVVYRYEMLARSELDKYHYQKAQQYISTGLSIDSKNERLKELQKKANLRSEPERTYKKVKNFFKNL